jgi:hypothetical protein
MKIGKYRNFERYRDAMIHACVTGNIDNVTSLLELIKDRKDLFESLNRSTNIILYSLINGNITLAELMLKNGFEIKNANDIIRECNIEKLLDVFIFLNNNGEKIKKYYLFSRFEFYKMNDDVGHKRASVLIELINNNIITLDELKESYNENKLSTLIPIIRDLKLKELLD